MSWDRPFDQPVPLPSGPPARTLRDAANYIKTLTSSERDTAEWRLAIQMLIDAAEDRGPMLFAKIGMLRAAERNVPRAYNPVRKVSIGDAGSWRGIDNGSTPVSRLRSRRHLFR